MHSILRDPEVKLEDCIKGGHEFEGYSMDLIKSIAADMNFTYRFEIEKENLYGSLDKKTKKWNGLIKVLLDRVSSKLLTRICDWNLRWSTSKESWHGNLRSDYYVR